MIVLSLFDGMGCGYEALKRAGMPVTKYYASEVDKYAMQIAKKNHPDIVYLGDVTLWDFWNIEKPDLIIGGSPCQGFSFAGKQLAFDDPRSKLFFTMMDIINYYKPKYRLLENVKMKKEFLDIISERFGAEPHFINSALVSAQNRQRYYWYNWGAPDPKDKGILLKDIVHESTDCDRDKSYCIDANYHKGASWEQDKTKARRQLVIKNFKDNKRVSGVTVTEEYTRPYKNDGRKGSLSEIGKIAHEESKSQCLISAHSPKVIVREKSKCVRSSGRGSYDRHEWDSITDCHYRKLTPIECERLQTLPDNYTEGVSNTQRYKMLGNGWTVDVVAHIFRHMKS